METLYHITVLLPASECEKAAAQNDTSQLGFYPDGDTVDDLRRFYKTLMHHTFSGTVCVALHAAALLNEEATDTMLSLCHHPDYYITKKKPRLVLMYDAATGKPNEQAVHQLQKKAGDQGWNGLEIITFLNTTRLGKNAHVLSLSVHEDDAAQERQLENYFQSETAVAAHEVLLKAPTFSKAHALIQTFLKLEQAFILKHKLYFDLYQQWRSTQQKLDAQEAELDRVKKELRNEQQYNEILKGAQETERILAFYHTEYEVLPLWYKQFGHIIKVLTGKRTFKSLFEDRVKKEL